MAVLTLATRRSALALRQTQQVADALRARTGAQVQVLALSTRGDEISDRPLAAVGGKALFVKGLQEAIADGSADAAVHSLKDMEAAPTPGFALAAVGFAAASEDVLVSAQHGGLAALPAGARVGTCSPRRTALLRHTAPALRPRSVRGNVQTRLAKLHAGEYDALLLAAAGLQRLGLQPPHTTTLPLQQFIPAPGQGLLGVECAADNARLRRLLAAVDDAAAHRRAQAERAFAAAMQGDCHTALGAHAVPDADGAAMHIHAFYADDDGNFYQARATAAAPAAAGEAAAAAIRRQQAER